VNTCIHTHIRACLTRRHGRWRFLPASTSNSSDVPPVSCATHGQAAKKAPSLSVASCDDYGGAAAVVVVVVVMVCGWVEFEILPTDPPPGRVNKLSTARFSPP
jgi:hypothetical protein